MNEDIRKTKIILDIWENLHKTFGDNYAKDMALKTKKKLLDLEEKLARG